MASLQSEPLVRGHTSRHQYRHADPLGSLHHSIYSRVSRMRLSGRPSCNVTRLLGTCSGNLDRFVASSVAWSQSDPIDGCRCPAQVTSSSPKPDVISHPQWRQTVPRFDVIVVDSLASISVAVTRRASSSGKRYDVAESGKRPRSHRFSSQEVAWRQQPRCTATGDRQVRRLG